jgi:molybdopterin-binding protein
VQLEVEDSSTHTRLQIYASNGTNNQAGLWLKNNDGDWQINNDDSTSDFIIYDDTNSADRLHITQSGNVGIGIASPDTSFHVSGTGADVIAKIECLHSVSSAMVDIVSAANRDSIVRFKEGSTVKARIINDASAESLVITDGADAAALYIKAGNVGISNDSPATKLHVLGASGAIGVTFVNSESHLVDADKILHCSFNNNGYADDDGHFLYCTDTSSNTHQLSIYSDGDVFSRTGDDIAQLSDERLKTNIADYSDGLAFINTLKPKKFNWKEGINRPSDIQYGFIAQEIEEVSDKSMRLYKKRTLGEDAPEHKYIDDGVFYTSQLKGKDAQYVSAIQELHTIIQELSAKVEALENA